MLSTATASFAPRAAYSQDPLESTSSAAVRSRTVACACRLRGIYGGRSSRNCVMTAWRMAIEPPKPTVCFARRDRKSVV